MRDIFRPFKAPARTLYDAFQEEATHREGRSVEEWLLAERRAVWTAARDYAQQHGLRAPNMDEVKQAENCASGHIDYGAKWAYAVAERFAKTDREAVADTVQETMNLISKQTITADSPVPVAHDYELTLTFKVTQYGSPVDPDLALALNRIFHDWNDGRHPFNVEMVNEGLRLSIKNALYQCCQKRAQEKYGPEMVQVGPNWRKSRWAIEAEKEFDELWKTGALPGLCDQPDIKIERMNNVP